MSGISEVYRLSGGSIDTDHYLARGRRLRSVAAHRLFLQLVRVVVGRLAEARGNVQYRTGGH